MTKRRHKYRRVVDAAINTPWAILPGKLEQIAELLSIRENGLRLTRAEIQARIGEPTRAPLSQHQNQSIAVLNLFGVIFPRADMMSEISGGTSAERFGKAFDQAVNDDSVSAIVINIDSPGGAVAGVAEVGDRIFEARGTKPIISVANYVMASAAYWIGCQADEIVAVKSATDVGSIGVLNIHREQSKADEAEGQTYTVIRSAKFKAEGNSHEPLTEAAQEHIQGRVNTIETMFHEAVARGRGIDVATVAAQFGQGRSFLAQQALSMGLIDRIASFDSVVADLTSNGEGASDPRHRAAFASAAVPTAQSQRFQSVRALLEAAH